MPCVCPTGAVGARDVLSPSTLKRCVCEVALRRPTDGGGQRKLRGGGEGASSTAHDSEQPVGCVAVGEGEW